MKKCIQFDCFWWSLLHIPLPSQTAVLPYLIGFISLKEWRVKFLEDGQSYVWRYLKQHLQKTDKKTEQQQMWLWAIKCSCRVGSLGYTIPYK